MVELIEAFTAALGARGLHAVAAQSAVQSPRLKQAAVAVRVEELEAAPGGFGSYLGMQGEQAIYGLRLHACVALDVLSPAAQGANACAAAMDAVVQALGEGVAGARIVSVTQCAPTYDPVDDCFRGAVRAQCRLWLCACEADEAGGTVEHFILKGALS